MLTGQHNDNAGDYATAAPLRAAQATGPPLQPQGSLTRSLTRRPPAALDPEDLYGPWQTHTAGRPNACPTGARHGTPTNCKITITESLPNPGRFSGDQTVRLWGMDVDHAIQRICATTTNNLTPVTWQQDVSPDLPYHPPCP